MQVPPGRWTQAGAPTGCDVAICSGCATEAVQSWCAEAQAAARAVRAQARGAAHQVAESKVVSLWREVMQRAEQMERQEQQIRDERNKNAEKSGNTYSLLEQHTHWEELYSACGRAVKTESARMALSGSEWQIPASETATEKVAPTVRTKRLSSVQVRHRAVCQNSAKKREGRPQREGARARREKRRHTATSIPQQMPKGGHEFPNGSYQRMGRPPGVVFGRLRRVMRNDACRVWARRS